VYEPIVRFCARASHQVNSAGLGRPQDIWTLENSLSLHQDREILRTGQTTQRGPSRYRYTILGVDGVSKPFLPPGDDSLRHVGL
jgi:hypothetical protein